MLRLATRRSGLGLYHTRTLNAPIRWSTTDAKGKPGAGAGGGEGRDGKGGVGNLKVGEAAKEAKATASKPPIEPKVPPPTTSTSAATSSTKGKPAPTPLEVDPPLPKPDPSSPKPTAGSPLATDIDRAKQSLAIWKDATLTLVRSRAQRASAEASVQFQELGGKLNKVTGYDAIEALKRRVVERERTIAALRVAAREAKEAYSQAVSARATRQREVNDMLQRKNTWSDADVLAFTKLVREDHLSASAEVQSKAALESAEAAVDAEFGALMRSILDRYHEEQVWSDKIRSVSTYGSLAALVANLVVFVLAIVLVEPWKRKRLAETFERRVVEMSEQTREVVGDGMKELEEHFEKQEKVLAQLASVALGWGKPVPVDHQRSVPVVEDTPEPVKEAPGETGEPLERWLGWIESMRPSTERDYTLVAIGGVGGLVGSGLVALLRSSSR